MSDPARARLALPMPAHIPLAAVILLVASGCTDSRDRPASDGGTGSVDGGERDDGGPDAGRDGAVPDGDAGPDATVPGADAGPQASCTEPGAAPSAPSWPTVGAAGESPPADYACLCLREAPIGGADITVPFVVESFQDGTPVPDLSLHVFPDGTVTDSCAAPGCTAAVTDASGRADGIGPAGGWLAVRSAQKSASTPATSYAATVTYNVVADTSLTTLYAVSLSTMNLIPTVLGFRRDSGTAILMGRVEDCAGQPVYGARARVIAPDGTVVEESPTASGTHYRYFDGTGFPSGSQPHTHADGLFIVANLTVPPTADPVRLEIWGTPAGEASPRLLGLERVRVWADTVTLVDPGPLRID